MREPHLRAPTLEDAVAVASVVNTESQQLRGRDDVTSATIRGWWTQPAPFDLARDTVVATADGAVVGYGDLGDQANDGSVLWLDVRGEQPSLVLAELERRARARLARGGVVRAVADERNDRLLSLLRERGFASIRASYHMAIDLAGRRFQPDWPEYVTVRSAEREGDETLLHRLLQSAFADHWGFTPAPFEEWRHWLYELGVPDPSLWFVVQVADEPAAAAICRPRQHVDAECGWVSELGVLPTYRRRGIASALLTHAFSAFQSRGLLRAGLGVDAENTTGAVRLYEEVGMRVVERRETWELQA